MDDLERRRHEISTMLVRDCPMWRAQEARYSLQLFEMLTLEEKMRTATRSMAVTLQQLQQDTHLAKAVKHPRER
jgi:hypothetical protein